MVPRTKSQSHYGIHSTRNFFVGVPGIEPGSYGPKPYILPMYYTPNLDAL